MRASPIVDQVIESLPDNVTQYSMPLVSGVLSDKTLAIQLVQWGSFVVGFTLFLLVRCGALPAGLSRFDEHYLKCVQGLEPIRA